MRHRLMMFAGATFAWMMGTVTPGHALLTQTISFAESGVPGSVPTVSGLYPAVVYVSGQPVVTPVVTGPEFATGPIELGSPGPGPIEPPGVSAAALLLDPATSAAEDLVVFQAGLVVYDVRPYQISMMNFYSDGAAACPDLIACIPTGVTPATIFETGGTQDITALFDPPFDLANIDNTIGYRILVTTPARTVPEPSDGTLIATALAGLVGVRFVRRTRSARRPS